MRCAATLRRIRREALLVPLSAAVAALVVAAFHPAWFLLVPLVIGGAATVYRPRYRKQVTRLYARLPAPQLVRRRRGDLAVAAGLVPGPRVDLRSRR